MRPKFLVGVIVGLLLVYLSFFGISGFGLSVLTETPENFSTYTKVDSAGYLSVASQSVTVTNMPRSAVSYLYKDFGVGHFGDVHLQFEYQASAIQAGNSFYILIFANQIGPSAAMTTVTIGFSEICSTTGSTYTFAFADSRLWETTNPFAMYYFDINRVGSVITLSIYTSPTYLTPVATLTSNTISALFQYLYVAQSAGVAGSTPTVSGVVRNLRIAGGGGSTYSHVTISVSGQGTTAPSAGDYPTTYYVGSSLAITPSPASGWSFDYMTRNGATMSGTTVSPLGATEQIIVYFKSGGSTTGILRVFASYNGAYVAASVTVAGPQTVYGTTTTDGNNPLTFTLTAGSYTVSGTYSSGSASPVSVNVPAGGTADAPPLNFGGPSPNPDFLAMIKAFFNQLAVKTLLLVSGLGSTIGCGIMFMLPSKGERSRPPPQYYSPY